MAKHLALRLYRAGFGRSEARVERRLRRIGAALGNTEVDYRLAKSLPPRPAGELIWIHAACASSQHAAIELFQTLNEDRPDLHGLLTTRASVKPVSGLPRGMIRMPLPEETDSIAQRFLTHWKPTALCWIGDGFRPGLLVATRKNMISSVYVEAPSSKLDLDAGPSFSSLRHSTMAQFDYALVGSLRTRSRWQRAGVEGEHIEVVGVLEDGNLSQKFSEVGFSGFTHEIGTRPCWFADHVTNGEVSDVLSSHAHALRHAHRLLLIIAPHNAAAYTSILRQSDALGLRALERNSGQAVSEETQVLVADMEHDERATWYRAAPLSFLGASLTHDGGISPYDAAGYGSAVVHGPHIAEFDNAYRRLASAGATRLVRGEADLTRAVLDLLAPDLAAQAAMAAWEAMSSGASAASRTADLLHDVLDLGEALRT